MSAELATEPPDQESPLFLKWKVWGLGFFPWMIFSWLGFPLGLPLWSALKNRDALGALRPLTLELQMFGFYSFIWLLWLIPLMFIAILVGNVIKLIWKREGFAHILFFTGTPILIGGLLLHTLVWPHRIENRFTADWTMPFPQSAKVIQIELRSGWLWSNSDVFHLRVRPTDLDAIIDSKALAPITPDEKLLAEVARRQIPIAELKDWQWYYLPPPQREYSGIKTRMGQSYLIISNPSRTEAFFYNNYHD